MANLANVFVDRDLAPRLLKAAGEFPAVTLTGPRQSGKSTLCRTTFPDLPLVNLEAPDTRAFATEDPRGFLAQFPDGAILDEIQRTPDLPSFLQGMIDENPVPGRWILTGSHNLLLLRSVGQSLAGRTAVLHLLPLARSEVVRFAAHPTTLDATLWSGCYPAIFDRNLQPSDWLGSYVATYLERDVRTVTNVADLMTFQRFVELCAGRTAQLLNLSALAGDAGVSQPTAKAWLSILEANFIVFRLRPFHSNLRKRLVKMPKVHFHDVGLACWLLGIRTPDQLRSHPLRGPIFESWVVAEILKRRTNHGGLGELSFYRDRDRVEADLLVEWPDRITIVEAKSSATASSALFRDATRVRGHLASLRGDVDSIVVYGGDDSQLRQETTLLPWNSVHEHDWSSG